MDLRQLTAIVSWHRIRRYFSVEAVLTTLTIVMIAAFHGIASEDRLLLNFYYIGIAGAAYSLVKRRALAQTVLVVFVAAGTTLAQIYLTAKPGIHDPLLDPVADLTSLFVLLFLGWLLATEAYRFQTEEHRLQIRRQIEEKALATRAAALASTSHEVRQPLCAILAITETLLYASPGPLNEVQHEFITDIDECAKHLRDLVNDILDYAKAESGMIKLECEAVALPELVSQCLTMVEPKAGKAAVTVTAHVDPGVSELVADPLRLKQILLNLLFNAVKFNQEGGLVRLQIRTKDDDVLISVRDTGRGIGAEQMEHLFDPYYQATHGDQGIGTGLGLSIVKHLVELHGGSVSVESVLDSGSTFTVRLPRKGAPGVEIPKSSERQTQYIGGDVTGSGEERHPELALPCPT